MVTDQRQCRADSIGTEYLSRWVNRVKAHVREEMRRHGKVSPVVFIASPRVLKHGAELDLEVYMLSSGQTVGSGDGASGVRSACVGRGAICAISIAMAETVVRRRMCVVMHIEHQSLGGGAMQLIYESQDGRLARWRNGSCLDFVTGDLITDMLAA